MPQELLATFQRANPKPTLSAAETQINSNRPQISSQDSTNKLLLNNRTAKPENSLSHAWSTKVSVNNKSGVSMKTLKKRSNHKRAAFHSKDCKQSAIWLRKKTLMRNKKAAILNWPDPNLPLWRNRLQMLTAKRFLIFSTILTIKR